MQRITSTLTTLLLLICSYVYGRGGGDAYLFDGTNQVNLGSEVLRDVKTFEMWFKIELGFDKNSPLAEVLMARDIYGPNSFSSGQVILYFVPAGGQDAGHLIFEKADQTTSSQISSNSDSWDAGRWYHVAIVTSPVDGMMMYINGVLQDDINSNTDEYWFRDNGPTGNVYLGRWGNSASGYFGGQIDELRFWSTVKSEAQIRSKMCSHISCSTDLVAYFSFDKNNSGLTGCPGVITQLNGASISSYIISSLPMGEESLPFYPTDWNGFIGSYTPNSIEYELSSINSSADGVHFYYDPDLPDGKLPKGAFAGLVGVWFTDPDSKYDLELKYLNLSDCENCKEILSRNDATIMNWVHRAYGSSTCAETFANEAPSGTGHRQEYAFFTKLEIDLGLPDSLEKCEFDSLYVSPVAYVGANYLWDDGSTDPLRVISAPGTYYLTFDYLGCQVIDSVIVKDIKTPKFSLPKDTTICEGDVLQLFAPISSDQVYWSGSPVSLPDDSVVNVWHEGKYWLTLRNSYCYYTDTINVTVLKPISMELGNDTTLCLGQPLELVLSKQASDVIWSNNFIGVDQTIFNEPGTYWAYQYNDCFSASDTIKVEYMECDCALEVPTAFTPNNDRLNDLYAPITACYFEEFDFRVIDRWGNIVFESHDPQTFWDGTTGGVNCPAGAYAWILRYKKYSWNTSARVQQGVLTLYR